MRDRFHSDPVIESAELLLQEKAPRDIPVSTSPSPKPPSAVKVDAIEISPDTRLILNPAPALRATNVMSNGHYSVMVTATGSGYSRWNELAVTRWQPDPDARTGWATICSCAMPTAASGGRRPPSRSGPQARPARRSFCDDKASFVKIVGTLRSEVECIVVSEGERRGAAHHASAMTAPPTGTSRSPPLPSWRWRRRTSDSAHPAFSKMFVETEIGAGQQRHLRDAGASARTTSRSSSLRISSRTVPGSARATEAETDRRAFIGRGRIDRRCRRPSSRAPG